MTKQIVLADGRLTTVDDEDYNYLSGWNWFAQVGYAARQEQHKRVRVAIFMHNVIAARAGYSPDLEEHKDGEPRSLFKRRTSTSATLIPSKKPSSRAKLEK